ncbi:hypothetical protein K9B32_15080 [Rhizobium sp. 3T7]|uniref:hypothetical protein n=1 Tax=Rhizobium sp. 3T7 TaxID=2874922 RepID=UPI001CCED083|nr:hypothetical protein [Rhizobium sp. 3T7]MBZ9791433.1 hypothetical protein [Rhizobium sp. 3T7]
MTRVDAISGCPSAICFELRPPTTLKLNTLATIRKTMIVMRIFTGKSASHSSGIFLWL